MALKLAGVPKGKHDENVMLARAKLPTVACVFLTVAGLLVLGMHASSEIACGELSEPLRPWMAPSTVEMNTVQGLGDAVQVLASGFPRRLKKVEEQDEKDEEEEAEARRSENATQAAEQDQGRSEQQHRIKEATVQGHGQQVEEQEKEEEAEAETEAETEPAAEAEARRKGKKAKKTTVQHQQQTEAEEDADAEAEARRGGKKDKEAAVHDQGGREQNHRTKETTVQDTGGSSAGPIEAEAHGNEEARIHENRFRMARSVTRALGPAMAIGIFIFLLQGEGYDNGVPSYLRKVLSDLPLHSNTVRARDREEGMNRLLFVSGCSYWIAMPIMLFVTGYGSSCRDGAPGWAYMVYAFFALLHLAAITSTYKVYQGSFIARKVSCTSVNLAIAVSMLEHSDMSSDVLSIGTAAACDAEVKDLWVKSWEVALSGFGSYFAPTLRGMGMESLAILFFWIFAWFPQIAVLTPEATIPASGLLFGLYSSMLWLLTMVGMSADFSSMGPILSFFVWDNTWRKWLALLAVIVLLLCLVQVPCCFLICLICLALVPLLEWTAFSRQWLLMAWIAGLVAMSSVIVTAIRGRRSSEERGEHRARWAGIYILDELSSPMCEKTLHRSDGALALADDLSPKSPASSEQEPEQPLSARELTIIAESTSEPQEMYKFIAMIIRLVGENVIQLSFQASLFALTLQTQSRSGKFKQLASLGISFITTMYKLLVLTCNMMAGDIEQMGVMRFMLRVFIIFGGWAVLMWSGAKVVMSFFCESGVWDVSAGCVEPLQ